MSLSDLQKKNIKENEVKTTKKQRRRKFSKFKDRMHNMWGFHKFAGIGDGRPNICDKCGEHVHKTKGIYNEIDKKWVFYCERCV